MYHFLALGFVALVIERFIEFGDWLYRCCFQRWSKELEESFSSYIPDMRSDLRHKIIEICSNEKNRRNQLALTLVQETIGHDSPAHLEQIIKKCGDYALIPAQEIHQLIEICRSYDARLKGKPTLKIWVMALITLAVSALFCWGCNFNLLARIDMNQFQLPGLGEISIPGHIDIAITAVLLAIASKYLHKTIRALATVKTRVKGQRGVLL